MNIRTLLVLLIATFAGLPCFGPGMAIAQSGNGDEARKEAYEAKLAAEKAFEGIDQSIKAMQARRPPIVPSPEMLKRREEAWSAFLKAAAAYSQYEDPKLKSSEAYKDVKLVHRKIRGSQREEFTKWLQGQKTEINDAKVRANLMIIVKDEADFLRLESKSIDVLRFLAEYGPEAHSYRDDLMAYLKNAEFPKLALAKPEDFKKFKDSNRSRMKAFYLVNALVRIDPSTKAELVELTKDWFLAIVENRNERLQMREYLAKALAGKFHPYVKDDVESRKDMPKSKGK